MDENWVDQEGELDRSQPWYAKYKHVWKVAQDAVYWVDIGRAQKMGLKFYQTGSNAIILHDTLPPVCIERVVSRKNIEILYTRISKAPRHAHTITLETNGRNKFGSECWSISKQQSISEFGETSNLKSRTVLDQQREREIKNEDEENDQASTVKHVTSMLDQQKEQEVKYEDGGNDQVRWNPAP